MQHVEIYDTVTKEQKLDAYKMPILNYAATLDSHMQCYINKLEAVQKRATHTNTWWNTNPCNIQIVSGIVRPVCCHVILLLGLSEIGLNNGNCRVKEVSKNPD